MFTFVFWPSLFDAACTRKLCCLLQLLTQPCLLPAVPVPFLLTWYWPWPGSEFAPGSWLCTSVTWLLPTFAWPCIWDPASASLPASGGTTELERLHLCSHLYSVCGQFLLLDYCEPSQVMSVMAIAHRSWVDDTSQYQPTLKRSEDRSLWAVSLQWKALEWSKYCDQSYYLIFKTLGYLFYFLFFFHLLPTSYIVSVAYTHILHFQRSFFTPELIYWQVHTLFTIALQLVLSLALSQSHDLQ